MTRSTAPRMLRALPDTPEVRELRDRHLAYYAELADGASTRLTYRDWWDTAPPPEEQPWYDMLDHEHGNFLAALEWCTARNDVATARRIIAGLGPYWYDRRRWSQYRPWVDFALSVDPEPSLASAGASRFGAALAIASSDWETGLRLYAAAAAQFHEAGDERKECGTLISLAWCQSAQPQPDYVACCATYDRAIEIARRIGERPLLAGALVWRAQQEAWSDVEAALAMLDEALTILRSLSDERPLLDHLGPIARTFLTLGDFERAAALRAERLSLARRVGDPRGLCSALLVAAYDIRTGGDPRAAMPVYEEATDLARANDLWDLGWALLGQAACALALDDLEEADRLCRDAEAYVADLDDRGLTEEGLRGGICHIRGELARARGDNGEAARLFEAAAETGAFYGYAQWASTRRAMLAEALGDRHTAARWYESALEEIRRYDAGSSPDADEDLTIAAIARVRDDATTEEASIERAVERARSSRARFLPHALTAAGELSARRGDFDGSRAELEEAVLESRRLHTSIPQALALLTAARVAREAGHRPWAARALAELLPIWRCLLQEHPTAQTDPLSECELAELVAWVAADDRLAELAARRRAQLDGSAPFDEETLRGLGSALDAARV